MRNRQAIFSIALFIVLCFVGVPVASAEGPSVHMVRPGDTLWSLSIRYGVTMDALLRANGLLNSGWLYSGQMLVIPRNVVQKTQYHVVRAGDTVFSISNRYGISAWALVRQNDIISNLIYTGQTLTIPGDCCSSDDKLTTSVGVPASTQKVDAPAPAPTAKTSLAIPIPTAKPAVAHLPPPVAQRRVLWTKPYTAGNTGFDISYPQCNRPYPTAAHSFIIVGVNGGKPFTSNDCFSAEYDWAARTSSQSPSIYMNLKYVVGSTADNGSNGPAGACSDQEETCKAYNYGYNAAKDAYDTPGSRTGRVWWIDLELENTWSSSEAMNGQVIQGAIDFFQNQGVLVGVYSSPEHWGKIAGSFKPRHVNQGVLPLWIFLADDLGEAPSLCSSSNAFGGGTPWLVQFPSNGFDGVYVCP